MSGPIRIYYRKFVDDMYWEFSDVFHAAEFVKELAEWELQKDYTREYITRAILKKSNNWISVLDHLGLRVERLVNSSSHYHHYFGERIWWCPYFRIFFKDAPRVRKNSDSDSDDYCPTCSDSDSDDYCPTCSDSDSDDYCPTCSDSDSDIGFRNC